MMRLGPMCQTLPECGLRAIPKPRQPGKASHVPMLRSQIQASQRPSLPGQVRVYVSPPTATRHDSELNLGSHSKLDQDMARDLWPAHSALHWCRWPKADRLQVGLARQHLRLKQQGTALRAI